MKSAAHVGPGPGGTSGDDQGEDEALVAPSLVPVRDDGVLCVSQSWPKWLCSGTCLVNQVYRV